MLVLSRRQGESVVLRHQNGDEVTVTVSRTGSGSVKLAVEAPEEVEIIRSEVWKKPNEQMKVPHFPPRTRGRK